MHTHFGYVRYVTFVHFRASFEGGIGLTEHHQRSRVSLPLPALCVGAALLVGVIILYLMYFRTAQATSVMTWVHQMGLWGIAAAIALMAILCILPVPSEFLMVANMEVYGVIWGIVYSWIGAIIGAVASMYISRWFGRPLVERYAPPERLQRIDDWMHARGTIGLFALRFIPFVPFHVLNYVSGLLRVRLWPFTWTTAIGIIPFDVSAAVLFAGISKRSWQGALVGVCVFIVLFYGGWMLRKRWFNKR